MNFEQFETVVENFEKWKIEKWCKILKKGNSLGRTLKGVSVKLDEVGIRFGLGYTEFGTVEILKEMIWK